MIAPNENGRATETRSVTPPVVIATAGRGAVNHSVQNNWMCPRGVSPEYVEPLCCPCNSEPWPCPECRAAIDATLARIRAAQGLDAGEAGYFVDSQDGEPRDGEEGYSNDN